MKRYILKLIRQSRKKPKKEDPERFLAEKKKSRFLPEKYIVVPAVMLWGGGRKGKAITAVSGIRWKVMCSAARTTWNTAF